MIYTFEIASIPIEAEYRGVKTMRLTVYPPEGRVLIAVPQGTPQDVVKKFAASKVEWIKKHREKFQSHSKLNSSLKKHSTVYVWGEAYELELVERAGNSKIVVEGGSLKLFSRPGTLKAGRQKILDRWYSRILKEAAPPIIKKWEKLIGVEMQKLFVRKMKTHWGSCNCQKRTIRLNSELAKRRVECLDYVIAHEMLHIIEKGHNRNFYRLLGQYIPDWKIIRKKMNSGEM